uniref:Uncharacterized protein n=1 Tax=Ixodes ricinus TaxID=34613 RepID=A0A0K8R8R7_IXORI
MTTHWFNNTWTFIDRSRPRRDPKRTCAYASTAFNQRQSTAHVANCNPLMVERTIWHAGHLLQRFGSPGCPQRIQ